MAKNPRRPARPSGPNRGGKTPATGRGRSGAGSPGKKTAAGKNATPSKKTASSKKPPVVFDAPAPAPEEPRTFRLGAVAGATPGKWIDAWKQRLPHVPLDLVPIAATNPHEAFATTDAPLDAALVRLPIADDALHVIRLYDELPVVVAAIDSSLLAADELTTADLEGEIRIDLLDDPLSAAPLAGTVPASFAALGVEDAIATAASGVGIVVVPMSLARLHHRKDVDYRVLTDGPTSTVALVWPRERTTPDVETFVGIVRGRTTNSSR